MPFRTVWGLFPMMLPRTIATMVLVRAEGSSSCIGIAIFTATHGLL